MTASTIYVYLFILCEWVNDVESVSFESFRGRPLELGSTYTYTFTTAVCSASVVKSLLYWQMSPITLPFTKHPRAHRVGVCLARQYAPAVECILHVINQISDSLVCIRHYRRRPTDWCYCFFRWIKIYTNLFLSVSYCKPIILSLLYCQCRVCCFTVLGVRWKFQKWRWHIDLESWNSVKKIQATREISTLRRENINASARSADHGPCALVDQYEHWVTVWITPNDFSLIDNQPRRDFHSASCVCNASRGCGYYGLTSHRWSATIKN